MIFLLKLLCLVMVYRAVMWYKCRYSLLSHLYEALADSLLEVARGQCPPSTTRAGFERCLRRPQRFRDQLSADLDPFLSYGLIL